MPEREDNDSEEMVRVSVRVPAALRDAIYSVGQERMIKPTQYAAICLATGHSLLSRLLAPESYLPNETMAKMVEAGSEPTPEEVAQFEAVLRKR